MVQPAEQIVKRDPLGYEALDVWSDPRSRPQPKQTGKKLLLNALASVLPAAPSVSGVDPRTASLWADYSHWNGDIDLTKTQPFLHGIMTKASDGKQMYKGDPYDRQNYKDKTLDRNIQLAYEAGIPCIPYHYFHFVLEPGWTEQTILDWQYDNIMEALKSKIPGKSFQAFALDIEEGGDSNTNAKSKVEKLTNRLHDALGVKILHYSRLTILNLFPALRDWLGLKDAERNLWLAQYIFSGRTPVSWRQLYDNYISRINMRVLTPGFQDWDFVQWSACFEVPGCTVNYTDLNFYHGTKEQAYAWLGYKQTQPEPPPPVVPPDGQDDHSQDDRILALEQILGDVTTELGRINARLNRHIAE